MRNEECVNYQSLSHLNLINFFFSFSLLNAFNPVKSLRDNGAGARTRFSQRLTRQGRKLVNLSKQSAYKLTQETTSTSSTRLRFFLLFNTFALLSSHLRYSALFFCAHLCIDTLQCHCHKHNKPQHLLLLSM